MTDVLEEVEARRAARKADLEKARKAQLAIDLEAIDLLEIEHGDSNIVQIELPFSPGLPTRVAAKTPGKAICDRYRYRMKGKDPDAAAAAKEVAESSLVYPDKVTYEKLCEARQALPTQLGLAALSLAAGAAAAEGKG